MPEKLRITSVVFEIDLNSEELDEKLSEIAEELFDKYDKGGKGFLNRNEL